MNELLKIEPRLLIEEAELYNSASAHDAENMLVHGGNILAFIALM